MSQTSDSKYIVSARKYRPATFKTVVGQKNLTATLKNAIATDRLAQAYLFCGPRGVGKTSCARIFAKTINCQHPTADGEACGECESCLAIEQGTSFNLVELDAASNNGINDIRNLTEQVNTPPQRGRYRVFIIDEVHMLSTAAFNAFLKTLEEPPEYVIFILATTEKHKVLPTILSRCQIYDFKRITINDMVEQLAYIAGAEGVSAEKEALGAIARKADGAMRDALSIFDQVAASSRGNITYQATIENLNVLDYEYYFQLTEAFRAGDVARSLLLYADIRAKGFDSLFFVNGLATHVRDLMLAADPSTTRLLEQSEEVTARYVEQARSLPLQWYYAAMKLLNDCDLNYRVATEKRLLVELTLIRLCQLLTPPSPPFDRVDANIPLQTPKPPEYQAPPTSATAAPAPPAPAPANTAPVAAATPPQPAAPKAPSAAKPSVANEPEAPKPRRAKSKGATGMFRLNEAEGEAAASTQATAGHTERFEPFTSQQLETAWLQFAASHPDMRILTADMRRQHPTVSEGSRIRIKVDNPSANTAYESHRQTLTEALRRALRNDGITLEIEYTPEENTSHYLPPKEFLQQICADNAPLAQFFRDIEAEII